MASNKHSKLESVKMGLEAHKMMAIVGMSVGVAAIAAVVGGFEIHKVIKAKNDALAAAKQVVPIYLYLNVDGNFGFNSNQSRGVATSNFSPLTTVVNLMANPGTGRVGVYMYASTTNYANVPYADYGTSAAPIANTMVVANWGYCYTNVFSVGCTPLYTCFYAFNDSQHVSVLSNTPNTAISGNTYTTQSGSGGVLGYTWDGTGSMPGTAGNPFQS